MADFIYYDTKVVIKIFHELMDETDLILLNRLCEGMPLQFDAELSCYKNKYQFIIREQSEFTVIDTPRELKVNDWFKYKNKLRVEDYEGIIEKIYHNIETKQPYTYITLKSRIRKKKKAIKKHRKSSTDILNMLDKYDPSKLFKQEVTK